MEQTGVETCDAIVVGGGPGGSACARRLVEGGLTVRVVDKANFPRDKTCAGWITPQVLSICRIDAQTYAQARVLQPVLGFRIGQIGRDSVEVRYDHPVSYGIRRCEFDHFLLENSGARLDLGRPVRSIVRDGRNWRVNDGLAAPVIVGAGGHFCPVAELLGARPGEGRVVAAQEVEFAMTEDQARECGVQIDIPELYFCDDLLGYGWCFRKGAYLNVGLGREDSGRLAEHVQSFVQFLQSRRRIPTNIAARYRGHAYSLYGHNRRARSADGLLVVGDAAGMANSPSGEGIRTAIESGILAAETLLDSDGDYGGPRLREYEHRLAARFGPPEPFDWAGAVPETVRSALGRWLFAIPWFARRVVLEHWFLHARPRTGSAKRIRSA